jgi:hypothetical protein
MSRPTLFFGDYDGGSLMAVGLGADDAGDAFEARVLSSPLDMGEQAAEAVYSALYITLSHRPEPVLPTDPYEEVEVLVTPYVDGFPRATTTVTVRMQPTVDRSNPPAAVSRSYVIGLYEPHLVDGVERGRNAMRGVFFQVRVVLPVSDLVLNGVSVEHTVVPPARAGTFVA